MIIRARVNLPQAALRRLFRRELARALTGAGAPPSLAQPINEPTPPARRPRARKPVILGIPGGARDAPAHQGDLPARETAARQPVNAGPGPARTIAPVDMTAKAAAPALPDAQDGGRADTATIRRWALDNGVRVNVMGRLDAHDIGLINAKRRLHGLPPFRLEATP